MNLRINGPKDFFAGLFYIALGSVAFVLSHRYRMGTASQMGPGYFPAMIGIVLIILGVGSVIQGVHRKTRDPIQERNIGPLLFLMAGILSFSILIDRAGLLVAIASLIFFACFRRLFTNPVQVLLTYLGLAAFSAIVFVHLFGMAIRLFPWD